MRIGESANNYPHVVCYINGDRRVIECAAGIQWVIQFRHRKTGNYQWEGESFCRTKEALLRLAGPHEKLLALPDRFPEERRHQQAEYADAVVG